MDNIHKERKKKIMINIKKKFFNQYNYSLINYTFVAFGLNHRNRPRFLCSGGTNRLYLIKPITSFANCDIEKKNIFSLARAQEENGVVYCWVNNANNKCYVGSSVNFTARLYKYYSAKHLYESKTAISYALYKYGYSNFSLHILEYCEKKNALNREQYHIDLLNPEYNILKKAGSLLGYKHTTKTLDAFKNRMVSTKTRNNLSLAASKRIFSKEEK